MSRNKRQVSITTASYKMYSYEICRAIPSQTQRQKHRSQNGCDAFVFPARLFNTMRSLSACPADTVRSSGTPTGAQRKTAEQPIAAALSPLAEKSNPTAGGRLRAVSYRCRRA